MRQMLGAVIIGALTSVAATTLAQENPPATPESELTDPCEGVVCSGHGRCVVVRGEPACACEEGFRADATGVNCIAPSTTGSTDLSQQREERNLGDQNAAAFANFDVPRRDLDGYKLWSAGLALLILCDIVASAGTIVTLAAIDEDGTFSRTHLGVGIGVTAVGLLGLVPAGIMWIRGRVRMEADRARRLREHLAR
jgi:hypothetical protein